MDYTGNTVNATFTCRRKKTRTFELLISAVKGMINNYIVYDERTPDKSLFSECKDCKYGHQGWVLKDSSINRTNNDTANIKSCKIWLISREPIMKESEMAQIDDADEMQDGD